MHTASEMRALVLEHLRAKHNALAVKVADAEQRLGNLPFDFPKGVRSFTEQLLPRISREIQELAMIGVGEKAIGISYYQACETDEAERDFMVGELMKAFEGTGFLFSVRKREKQPGGVEHHEVVISW